MGIGTGLAVAGIGSSLLSASSANKAANAQTSAARNATIFQEQMAREAIKSQRDTLTAQLENANDSSAAAIREQINALDAQLAIADETRDKQVGVYQPYQQAGLAGQNQLMNYLGIGGGGGQGYGQFATAEFTPEAFAAGQDPGYAFRMKEGLKAVDAQAAARGGLISGAALKASQRFGQDMASQEYQNAFNRYQTTRQNTLAPYERLQGVGMGAAQGLAGAYGGYGAAAGGAQSAYGNNVSNLQTGRGQMINAALGNYGNQVTGALTGYGNAGASNMLAAGNAQSAGQIGQANAINQGISGVSNMYYQNQMLNMLRNPTQQAVAQYGAGNVYLPGGGGATVPTGGSYLTFD
jgi:hypothetical protein